MSGRLKVDVTAGSSAANVIGVDAARFLQQGGITEIKVMASNTDIELGSLAEDGRIGSVEIGSTGIAAKHIECRGGVLAIGGGMGVGMEVDGKNSFILNGGAVSIQGAKVGLLANSAPIDINSGSLDISAELAALLGINGASAAAASGASLHGLEFASLTNASGTKVGVVLAQPGAVPRIDFGTGVFTNVAAAANIVRYEQTGASGLITYTYEDWLRDNQYDQMAPSSGLQPDAAQDNAGVAVPGNVETQGTPAESYIKPPQTADANASAWGFALAAAAMLCIAMKRRKMSGM